MSRDWSEVKRGYENTAFKTGTYNKLLEAIAEIEQLRQEKAELVDALGMVADHLESTAKYAKLTDVVRAKAILSKLEGGEPNAKP